MSDYDWTEPGQLSVGSITTVEGGKQAKRKQPLGFAPPTKSKPKQRKRTQPK